MMTGNALVCFSLLAMLQLAGRGVGILEQPAPPQQAEAGSIWKLPILQLILSFADFRLLHIAQGLWGAPTAKPTTLLLLNAEPEKNKELHRWRTAEIPPGRIHWKRPHRRRALGGRDFGCF